MALGLGFAPDAATSPLGGLDAFDLLQGQGDSTSLVEGPRTPTVEVVAQKPNPDAGYTESELVTLWRGRIAEHESWRDKQHIREDDEEVMDLFDARKEDSYDPDEPLAYTNWIKIFWELRMAGLSKQRPKPIAKRQNATYDMISRQAEAALDYTSRETRVKDQMELALSDAILSRYGGFVTTKYHSEFGTLPTHIDRAGNVVGKDNNVVEYSPDVKWDNCVTRYIHGSKVYFAPNVKNIKDSPWLGLQYDRPIRDFINDRRYRRTVVNEVVGGIENYRLEPNEKTTIPVMEVWSKATGKIYTFVKTGADSFLMQPRFWPYDLDGEFPIEQLRFVVLPDSPYQHASPGGSGIDLIREYNFLRTKLMEKSANTVPHTIAPEGWLGPQGRMDLDSVAPGGLIEIKGDPDSIKPWPTPQAGMDERFLGDSIRADIRFSYGIDENTAGAPTPERGTATESLIRFEASNNRLGAMQAKWDDFWSRVMRKNLLLIQQFWEPGRYIPLLSPKNDDLVDTLQWSDEARNAEFAIVGVEVGSAAPPSKEAQQSKSIEFLSTLTQFIPAIVNASVAGQQIGLRIDVTALLREGLKPFQDEFDVDSFLPEIGLNQNPDTENQAVLFGNSPQVSPYDQDAIHLPVHMQFFYLLQQDQYDYTLYQFHNANWQLAKQTAIQNLGMHIAAHQAKQQMAMSGQQQPQQPGMGQPGGQQMMGAPGGEVAPGQGDMMNGQAAPLTEGVMTPNTAGGFANAMRSRMEAGAAPQQIAAAMGSQMGGPGNAMSMLRSGQLTR